MISNLTALVCLVFDMTCMFAEMLCLDLPNYR